MCRWTETEGLHGQGRCCIPTVATAAVFLTSIIDAMENQEVVVFDVPGAFMQANTDELVHVRFTGKMVLWLSFLLGLVWLSDLSWS